MKNHPVHLSFLRRKRAATDADLSDQMNNPAFKVDVTKDGELMMEFISGGNPTYVYFDNPRQAERYFTQTLRKVEVFKRNLSAMKGNKFAATHSDFRSLNMAPFLDMEEMDGEYQIYFVDGSPQYLYSNDLSEIYKWADGMSKRLKQALKDLEEMTPSKRVPHALREMIRVTGKVKATRIQNAALALLTSLENGGNWKKALDKLQDEVNMTRSRNKPAYSRLLTKILSSLKS